MAQTTYVNDAGKTRDVYTAEQAVKARHDGFHEKRAPRATKHTTPTAPSTDAAAK